MNIQFVTGDKVRLSSGGPEMTIRGAYYDKQANEYRTNMFECIWFAKNTEGKEQVQYQPFRGIDLVRTNTPGVAVKKQNYH